MLASAHIASSSDAEPETVLSYSTATLGAPERRVSIIALICRSLARGHSHSPCKYWALKKAILAAAYLEVDDDF